MVVLIPVREPLKRMRIIEIGLTESWFRHKPAGGQRTRKYDVKLSHKSSLVRVPSEIAQVANAWILSWMQRPDALSTLGRCIATGPVQNDKFKSGNAGVPSRRTPSSNVGLSPSAFRMVGAI